MPEAVAVDEAQARYTYELQSISQVRKIQEFVVRALYNDIPYEEALNPGDTDFDRFVEDSEIYYPKTADMLTPPKHTGLLRDLVAVVTPDVLVEDMEEKIRRGFRSYYRGMLLELSGSAYSTGRGHVGDFSGYVAYFAPREPRKLRFGGDATPFADENTSPVKRVKASVSWQKDAAMPQVMRRLSSLPNGAI